MSDSTPRLPDVDLVIFDLDGTLADSSGDLAAAVNHARTEMGLTSHEVRTVISFVGDGVGPLIERAFSGCSTEELRRARELFADYYSTNSALHTETFPGIPELLDALADRRMAVVTNKAERFVPPLLEHLGIDGHFDAVIGERPGLARKPAPDMVLHILERLRVAPTRAILVGDGVQDLGAGRAAGLRVVRVSWGYGHAEDAEAIVPDLEIDHPSELLRALE